LIRKFSDPILKQACTPFQDSDEEKARIGHEMCSVLRAAKGAGIAAPQVGFAVRAFVLHRVNGYIAYQEFWNPTILQSSGIEVAKEGCLSYPGIWKELVRAAEVLVEYENAAGEMRTESFRDFDARVIQHEMDHLEGKCRIGEK